MIPCIIVAGIVGVFVAMWIRPIYKVDALLQIETKSNKSVGLMGGLPSLFASSSPAETEIELINSRQIIGDAVEKMYLQYEANPINVMDRLLHREGRMELNQYEIPWDKIPEDEKIKPWIAEATDSTSFKLIDHNDKEVLSGTVGKTYHFIYAGDTATFSVFNMKARAGQRFELFKRTRLDAISKFKSAFDVGEKGKKTGILEFSYQDIYDDRIAVTSPGGMYSGQQVQDVPLEDISSLRRNPVLADVMAQLDYMEKRGSGLKRICNETKALEAYKDDRRPVFKSSPSQFMTIIYSVDYKDAGQDTGQDTGNVTKQSLSSHQVVTKLSSSIPMICDLLEKMISPMSAKEMRQFCGLKDATYFKTTIIDTLIEGGLVAMTQPDSPKSPTQKYYLTELGKQLIEK